MQQSQPVMSRTLKFFFAFACVGIGVWFLNSYAALFNSFFLALMIVMTASPLGFWLRNHSVPKSLSLILSVLAALAVTLFIAGVLAVSALRVLEIIPVFVNVLAKTESGAGPLLSRFGITLQEIQELVPPETVGRVATDIITLTLESVSMFGLVILIVIFMIIEAFIVPEKLKGQDAFSTLPPDVASGFTRNIRQYVGITSLLGLTGGAVLALVLYLLDIQFAVMWGILYFVLNFVPMVGFWLAVVPPMLLAGLTGGATAAIVVLVAYMIVSTIINQAVKPAVMRGGLDLSPFWSISSLIIWSSILGPIGLIVGVPLTIALKELVFEPDIEGRWLADMLGAGLPQQEEVKPEEESAEAAS